MAGSWEGMERRSPYFKGPRYGRPQGEDVDGDDVAAWDQRKAAEQQANRQEQQSSFGFKPPQTDKYGNIIPGTGGAAEEAAYARSVSEQQIDQAWKAQNRTGPQVNYSQADKDREMQLQSRYDQSQGQRLALARALGYDSAAKQQAAIDQNRLHQAQASMAASARGPGAMAMAQQNAAANQAAGSSAISAQSQVAASQERAMYTQQYNQAVQAQRAQDLQSQGMSAQQAQYQAGLEMQQRQANDQYSLGMQGLGLGWERMGVDVQQEQVRANQELEKILSGNWQFQTKTNADSTFKPLGSDARMKEGVTDLTPSSTGAGVKPLTPAFSSPAAGGAANSYGADVAKTHVTEGQDSKDWTKEAGAFTNTAAGAVAKDGSLVDTAAKVAGMAALMFSDDRAKLNAARLEGVMANPEQARAIAQDVAYGAPAVDSKNAGARSRANLALSRALGDKSAAKRGAANLVLSRAIGQQAAPAQPGGVGLARAMGSRAPSLDTQAAALQQQMGQQNAALAQAPTAVNPNASPDMLSDKRAKENVAQQSYAQGYDQAQRDQEGGVARFTTERGYGQAPNILGIERHNPIEDPTNESIEADTTNEKNTSAQAYQANMSDLLRQSKGNISGPSGSKAQGKAGRVLGGQGNPTTQALAEGLKPYAYDYKPGLGPPGRNVGPMAQNMTQNPITATAVTKDPNTGLLALDRDKLAKLNAAGVGAVAEQQQAQQAQINALARAMGTKK